MKKERKNNRFKQNLSHISAHTQNTTKYVQRKECLVTHSHTHSRNSYSKDSWALHLISFSGDGREKRANLHTRKRRGGGVGGGNNHTKKSPQRAIATPHRKNQLMINDGVTVR